MNKKVANIIKINLKGGSATPAPPVGPALAGKVKKPIEFVNAFNAKTKDKRGELVRVEITTYQDLSFDFKIKEAPASYLIKKAIGIEKGSSESNRKKVASITEAQLIEIAKRKMVETNGMDIEAVKSMLAGTARSMGITIKK